MDCNKEEAIRAKGIAEKKMENKDFVGAQKIALKAQRLDPDLENILQIITVCDVHCFSENNAYGNDKDWYSILKIDHTADEASIKKQFRKFALLLHPDKNKFPGAADAFKLIGEAQRVLLDRDKRLLFDNKCNAFGRSQVPSCAPQAASQNPNVHRQTGVQNNCTNNATSQFRGMNPRKRQPKKPSLQETFWTVCPFCGVRYQFYKEVVNKFLGCQSCKKPFTAYEIKGESTKPSPQVSSQADSKIGPKSTSQMPCSGMGFSGNFDNDKAKSFPSPHGASKTVPQSTLEKPSSRMGLSGNFVGEKPTSESFPEKGCASEVGGSNINGKNRNGDTKTNKNGGSEQSKFSGTGKGKRRKEADDLSESYAEEDTRAEEDGVEHCTRRSSRSRQRVSYNENLNNDDDNELLNPFKRSKASQPFCGTEHEVEEPLVKEEENGNEETKKANEYEKLSKPDEPSPNSSPEILTDPEIYEYPDPDFSDFDKGRTEGCFLVGQIWAIYDTLDAMPRFYARIRKIFSPGFKVQITWLEPDPDHEDEIKWMNEGLPVSCGKFQKGDSEITEDLPMFSHLICWEKGEKRDTCKIYPRKGETWALFKNWDMKWYSDSEKMTKFQFEFVHVLSDYDHGVGVRVGYLGKMKGYTCLFCRTGKEGNDSFQIPPSELFRFSHRIPSFQMSGEERKDVPEGSFELDPASLPANVEEIDFSCDLYFEDGKLHCNGSSFKSEKNLVEPLKGSVGNSSECLLDEKIHLDSEGKGSNNSTEDHTAIPPSPEAFEIPEPEFYNFDSKKALEKFQIGQIWALYSDEDGLPKYYGQIKKINSHPEFELVITWLLACSIPKEITRWLDKKMPISCGTFKPSKGKTQKYNTTDTFSHQLRAEITDKKDVYVIFPRKGEVWALYKNWNAGIKCSDLVNWDYEMVEILGENELWIEVSVLELVNGFKSVFKTQVREGSSVTMKVPRFELLRFSHQIPAFRLTEERGGSLRGFWELDPAALPVILFCSS